MKLDIFRKIVYLTGTAIFVTCQINEPVVKGSTRPNIVWIVAEDLGPYIPSFGDSTIETPNLSRLSQEGICFDQVYSPSPVCAPSRAALATGMYPTHIGANHMRTGPWYFSNITQQIIDDYANQLPEGISAYEAIIPEGIKMFSQVLRENGYYCTNNSKEDYQFRKSPFAWDESSTKAHWRNRTNDQPFFSVFNLGITHESQIWSRAGDSLWVPPDMEVPGFPYLPKTDSALMDIRRMYSNVKIMDKQIGDLLMELEDDGLIENTIVFWFTDHGGPLPRQKRLLYDAGLKVPMIVRFPNGKLSGTRDNRMISFIDFAPTILSLADIEPPEQLDGKAFLGTYQRVEEPTYIFAASDRFDESYDAARAVRDKRYKYIRYLNPDKPMFLHIKYRDQMAIMRELYRLKEEGSLTTEQELWFRQTKPKEEFFDTWMDPHEVYNLIEEEQLEEDVMRFRRAYDRWENSFVDLNRLPEDELMRLSYPNNMPRPTDTPTMVIKDGMMVLEVDTPGATIGYQTDSTLTAQWKIYTSPLDVDSISFLTAIAHRIGYKESEVFKYKLK